MKTAFAYVRTSGVRQPMSKNIACLKKRPTVLQFSVIIARLIRIAAALYLVVVC